MQLVYGVCLKYFKNRDDSQDAVIGIFEKLVTEIDRHHIQNFRSWLYVLTKNYCLMELRSDGFCERKLLGNLSRIRMFLWNLSLNCILLTEIMVLAIRALEDCISKLEKGTVKTALGYSTTKINVTGRSLNYLSLMRKK